MNVSLTPCFQSDTWYAPMPANLFGSLNPTSTMPFGIRTLRYSARPLRNENDGLSSCTFTVYLSTAAALFMPGSESARGNAVFGRPSVAAVFPTMRFML